MNNRLLRRPCNVSKCYYAHFTACGENQRFDILIMPSDLYDRIRNHYLSKNNGNVVAFRQITNMSVGFLRRSRIEFFTGCTSILYSCNKGR